MKCGKQLLLPSIPEVLKEIDLEKGKVIGKQGRIAKSIRTVMKSVAGKEHKKVTIEFLN